MARLSRYLCAHGVRPQDVQVGLKSGSGLTWVNVELGDGIELSVHADPEDGAQRVLEAIRDTAQAELDLLAGNGRAGGAGASEDGGMTSERRRIPEAMCLNAADDLYEAIEGLDGIGREEITIRWSADGEGKLDIQCPPRMESARIAIGRIVSAHRAIREPVR